MTKRRYALNNLFMFLVLFITGGAVYIMMELWFRGYSHWTMFLVGGICYIEVGYLNEFIPWEVPLATQCLIGTLIITVNEFLSGCIINLWLGWHVWDYSELPMNIKGQVCLPFCFLWFFISAVCIFINDLQRYAAKMGEIPHYHVFKLPAECKAKKYNIIKEMIKNWKNRRNDRKKYITIK